SGLERVTSAAQDVTTVFDIDLFAGTMGWIRGSAARQDTRSERIVADHLRAMTFLIGDGVVPANEGRGYVLRRVIRRAQLHARRLGISAPLADGMLSVAKTYRDRYPELGSPAALDVVRDEVARF